MEISAHFVSLQVNRCLHFGSPLIPCPTSTKNKKKMYILYTVSLVLVSFQADAEEFLKVVTEVNAASPAKVDQLDADLMKQLAFNAQGDICPTQAFIGGISAQEVMKVG